MTREVLLKCSEDWKSRIQAATPPNVDEISVEISDTQAYVKAQPSGSEDCGLDHWIVRVVNHKYAKRWFSKRFTRRDTRPPTSSFRLHGDYYENYYSIKICTEKPSYLFEIIMLLMMRAPKKGERPPLTSQDMHCHDCLVVAMDGDIGS